MEIKITRAWGEKMKEYKNLTMITSPRHHDYEVRVQRLLSYLSSLEVLLDKENK